jgi:hypothetical protein
MGQQKSGKRTLIWGLFFRKNRARCWDSFLPLRIYQARIAKLLSMDMRFTIAENVHEALSQFRSIKPDILFLCPKWDVGCEETKYLIDLVRACGNLKKIIFIDAYDATCTPYLPLLADVDLYIKHHLLRDTRLYLQEFIGGYIFTDFLVKRLGWHISDWHQGSRADERHLVKMRAGWSYGASRMIRKVANFSSRLPMPWAFRRTDLNRRFSPIDRPALDWYEQHRNMALNSVEGLSTRIKISGYERVDHTHYLIELMTSKMVLSPFGWGEVCIRDYEAVACGAMLIKPDMSHVHTNPDIFKANETYVPVKWDFSDLSDKVDYYTLRPNEAKRIALAGRQRLLKYFNRMEFLDDFRNSLGGTSSPIVLSHDAKVPSTVDCSS